MKLFVPQGLRAAGLAADWPLATLARAAALKAKYLHHIREEEQEQFVAAEKTLGDPDKRHMLGIFDARKRAENAAAKVEKQIRLN